MRVVYKIDTDGADDLVFCGELSKDFEGAFGKMGYSLSGIKGDNKFYRVPTGIFPKTIGRLNNTVTNHKICATYKLSTWLFEQV